MSEFEITGKSVEWHGRIIQAGRVSYRFADGEEVTYDRVWHPGAATILPVDREHVWLIRQPREAAGLADSLEVPAGKREGDDEPLLELAKRELAEEIGKHAAHWREITSFYLTPAFSDERNWLFLATGLSDLPDGPSPDQHERIEIVPWPLTQLDQAIAATQDSKTLVALLWLKSQDPAQLDA